MRAALHRGFDVYLDFLPWVGGASAIVLAKNAWEKEEHLGELAVFHSIVVATWPISLSGMAVATAHAWVTGKSGEYRFAYVVKMKD